jgi:ATP-dependent helicase IRC3
VQLRPYQSDALNCVRNEFRKGVSRQLVVMATGTGKSVLFANLHSHLGLKGQVWVLTARNELADQAAGHLRRNNPSAKVGIERAGYHADPDSDFIVGSIQTIGTVGDGFTRRIKRFDPDKVSAIVVDEAHHSVSKSYANVLRYFGVLKGDPDEVKSRLLVGVTATPSGRSDGQGLSSIFESIVYQKDIREFINEGWLAPILGHHIQTEIDLSKVRMARGDFAVGELEKTVNTPERCALIVEKYKEICGGKSAIAFTVNVAHSHSLAIEFRRSGITAMPFSGQTPDEERKRLLAEHESGELKVIISCAALGEGVDLPWAEAGLLCAPTASGLNYAQRIGRLLRPFPAPEAINAGATKIKEAAVILDFVDVSLKHKLVTVPSLFGLRPDFDTRGESITKVLEAIEAEQAKTKQLRLDSFRDLSEMYAVSQTIDLLKPPTVPVEIAGMSNLIWFAGPGGSYQIVGPSEHLSIRQNQLGQYEISKHENGLRRMIRTVDTLEAAIRQSEGMIPSQDLILLKSGSKWRAEPPTQKQIRLLSTLDKKMFDRFGRDFMKFSRFIESSYSKGDVSNLLSQRMQGRRSV